MGDVGATERPAAARERRRAGPGLAEIVRTLEADIIFGRLRPRERLVEDMLMERLGVTRHLVRQALFELERLGIVVRERNKGCAVRYFPPAEVEHIYELREVLQAHAARRIPIPAPGALIEALDAIHAEHSRAVEKGDLGAVYRLNNRFHNTLFAASGNPRLVEAIAHYAWLAHAIRSYRIADPRLLRQARDEHGAMIEALRRGDRDTLVRLAVAHIQPSKEAYLALEKAVAETA
jgi:DNA-binding GntR family transcriptional regulator